MQGDCLPGWTLFESHCYLLFKDDLKSWSDAEIDCLNHNANLLYILSAGEEEFLDSQMINSSSNIEVIYIGLKENGSENERFSVWRSGHEVIYTNWEDGPENDADNISISLSTDGDTCAIKDVGFNGKWRNGTCSKRLPYICKRKGMTFKNRQRLAFTSSGSTKAMILAGVLQSKALQKRSPQKFRLRRDSNPCLAKMDKVSSVMPNFYPPAFL